MIGLAWSELLDYVGWKLEFKKNHEDTVNVETRFGSNKNINLKMKKKKKKWVRLGEPCPECQGCESSAIISSILQPSKSSQLSFFPMVGTLPRLKPN